MRWIAWALGAALLVPLAAGAEEETMGKPGSGEALYHQYCGACHGTGARGDGPVAEVLDPKPADLTRIAARRDGVFPAASIGRIIDGRDPIVAHGTRAMPIWGNELKADLPPAMGAETRARGTILLIVEYLRSIQVADGG